MSPFRSITPSFHEKVWGSTGLAPWFPNPENKTGEVWFDGGDHLPLIKFLFTTDRLSVQVHPDDEYAAAFNSRGKTEMWHVLQAAPGAQVAIGFRRRLSREHLTEAVADGTVVSLLNWIRVRPGDTLFVPAGTVHAIGAGLAICEIQQRSDLTFRLFDYGRPRELHLEQALAVASLSPFNGRAAMPVRCPFFHAERLLLQNELPLEPLEVPSALIVVEGEGMLKAGLLAEPFLCGHVFELAPGKAVLLRGTGVLLRTWIP
ncbi:MAG: class I mannose-6-phosphate isomerase [Bryobacteraceae bacterium]|nr:class I mannose-6-phosphate isomerase [Bryobacteraceae bacterium]MDW8376748.1 class I mannose-6-phosphate isomerase [Bryobacterales bacterium]